MRAQSHRCLGQYLVSRYMGHVPKHCTQAFLIGCTQPDWNPATYLKGSLRYEWLRGHNYRNARHLIGKFSRRLEQKSKLHCLDYYTLGKLIHYTADAFTYAHNSGFSLRLTEHRLYEAQLQTHFLEYLRQNPHVNVHIAESIMDALRQYHEDYILQAQNIQTDARYALHACCAIFTILGV